MISGQEETLAHDEVRRRMDAALEIAEAAGRLALSFLEQRDTLRVESKGRSQDWVSAADRDVERAIWDAVRARFPDDQMVGEEHGTTGSGSKYVWVVDPIDGTLPFLTGQPFWCVSIAVVGPRGIEAGVVHAPVLRETWTAMKGAGAFLNGDRLALDPDAVLTSGNVGYGATQTTQPDDVGAFASKLYRAGGVFFRVGSGALMLCYTASSRLAGYYDPSINAWDCFAGNLIVEEAGGEVVFEGAIGRAGRLFAGNPVVVAALQGLV